VPQKMFDLQVGISHYMGDIEDVQAWKFDLCHGVAGVYVGGILREMQG